MSFNFQVNGRTTLELKNQGDLMGAMFQVEYIKQAEGKATMKCAM